MGTKKLLRKLQEKQKRVPLKRAKIQKQSKKVDSNVKSNLQIEQIESVSQIEEYLESNRLNIDSFFKTVMLPTTENKAFESKRIHELLKISLNYVLEKKKGHEELEIFIDELINLDCSYKWALLEWVQNKLKYYHQNIDIIKEDPQEFIIFSEIINGFFQAPKEIENPVIQALITLSCMILQDLNIVSLKSAMNYFIIYWELWSICENNNLTAPELLALLMKLVEFTIKEISPVENEEGKNDDFFTLISNQKFNECKLVKGIAKLLENIISMFTNHSCCQAIFILMQEKLSKLSTKFPYLNAKWEQIRQMLSNQVQIKEKIKNPLQLHAEKMQEIVTFEPIIEDEFIHFDRRFRVENEQTKKQEDKKLKLQQRVEVRKAKKMTVLREELKADEFNKLIAKQESYKKDQRKIVAEDFIEYKKMMSSAHALKFDPNRKKKKVRLAGNDVQFGKIKAKGPNDMEQ